MKPDIQMIGTIKKKQHIKMYGDDALIDKVKIAAKNMGVSQSTYLLLAVNEKLKGDK